MIPAATTEIWFLNIYANGMFRHDFACTTREGVIRRLDEWIISGWERHFPDLPMPEDYETRMLHYFTVGRDHDRYEIHQSHLHFTCRVCGRLLPADMVCPVCFPQKQEYQDVIEEEE